MQKETLGEGREEDFLPFFQSGSQKFPSEETKKKKKKKTQRKRNSKKQVPSEKSRISGEGSSPFLGRGARAGNRPPKKNREGPTKRAIMKKKRGVAELRGERSALG